MKSSFSAVFLYSAIHLVQASPLIPRTQQPQYEIQWGSCGDILPQGLECGQMRVPLDWNSTNGEQITLAMARIKTANTTSRIGTIVYNPGGPGDSAIEICAYHASGLPVFSEQLTEHFDIVCPDPRGVGSSTPVACDPEVWNDGVSYFPANQNELEKLIASNKAKGQSCLNVSGDLVKHVDTVSAAKDIEAIRLALNDGKLNWFGQSYGSMLGAAYAELYPENIRAMALDGMTDHSQTRATTFFTESTTCENSLDRFFDWCAANTTACGFASENIPVAFDNLVGRASQSPIPAPGCNANADTTSAGTCASTVTDHDIQTMVTSFLRFKNPIFGVLPGWGQLGLALNQTITQNNATLFSSPIATTNTSAIFVETAISCLDWARFDTTNLTLAFSAYNQSYVLGNAFNPHIGPASQSFQIEASCAGWPVNVVDKPHLLSQSVSKAPPVLMVNAVHDTSTSYVWALSMHEQMPTSTLLTREGDGHTSYFLHGDAAALIDQYLIDLSLPAPGTVVGS